MTAAAKEEAKELLLEDYRYRAEMMRVAEHVTIRVPQTSDLILLKLAAGGYLDLRDAAALLAIGDRDALVREVDTRIGEVRPDVRGVWADLLRETS